MKYVENIFCWFFWVLFFSCFSTIHDVCWFVRCFWYWADAPPIWRCDDLCSGHVFQGVYKEPQMIQIMDRFRAQLGRVSKEIEKRNEKRLHDPDMGFKNIHADPKIVECSVAVWWFQFPVKVRAQKKHTVHTVNIYCIYCPFATSRPTDWVGFCATSL